jgi:hypothetical protein
MNHHVSTLHPRTAASRLSFVLLALALLALPLVGCGGEPAPAVEPAPPTPPPPPAAEPVAAPTPAPEPEVEPTAEEIPVADDFAEEAEQSIDEKSYRKELAALEKELNAEAATASATP